MVSSDCHGKTDLLKQVIKENKHSCVAFLDCGDLQLYSEFDKPLYFVHGNHEDFNVINAMDNGNVEFKNLRYIKNGEVVSIVVNNHPINILGFGGNYSPKDFVIDTPELAEKMLQGYRKSHFATYEYNNVIDRYNKGKLPKIHILLTHEPPKNLINYRVKTKEKKDVVMFDIGCDVIENLFTTINPDISLSGHHHTFKKYVNYTLTKQQHKISIPSFRDGYVILNLILNSDNNLIVYGVECITHKINEKYNPNFGFIV